MELLQQFEQAVIQSKILAQKPDNNILLQLYSLYKQATEGDAPDEGGYGMFDFVAKAKHDAWLQLKSMTKEIAMQQYVDLVHRLSNI